MRLLTLVLVTMGLLSASEWSAAVDVLHELKPCVTYRAKLDGPMLVIEAAIQPGWHTFAIDNEQRAAKKLAGKPSLGIDQPTQITVGNGLEIVGPWYQLEPLDFSKPELRWYSFGYEKQAIFAARIRRSPGAGPAKIGIRGQACLGDSVCKNIDVSLAVPLAGAPARASTLDLTKLVQVQ
jgi:DsbC/DsbD-like thiol-disulfide interchange protein